MGTGVGVLTVIGAVSSLMMIPVASASAMLTPESSVLVAEIITKNLSEGSITPSPNVSIVMVLVAPGPELAANATVPVAMAS